jgi:hypothetical protein
MMRRLNQDPSREVVDHLMLILILEGLGLSLRVVEASKPLEGEEFLWADRAENNYFLLLLKRCVIL